MSQDIAAFEGRQVRGYENTALRVSIGPPGDNGEDTE